MKTRIALLTSFLVATQSACIVVGGGYSSRGGWFIWPGGLGLVVVVALLYLFFGRGR